MLKTIIQKVINT